MFWKLFTRNVPLTGAPSSRRIKTYSAQTGYVYEYFYRGRRAQDRQGERQIEYVFGISSGAEHPFDSSVFLPDSVVALWERANERQLSSTEKYALAKMALFQAFDERPTPSRMKKEVTIHLADVEAFAAALGL